MNFENVIPVPAVEPETTDYYGENGLLYCGVCHEPKEAFFPNGTVFGGKDRHPAECACQRKRREADEAEREEYHRRLRIRDLRERCFINPTMRKWTFANATIRNKRVEQAMRYVDRWTTVREENCGLLFWGSVGTGKSFLAGCIANALLEKEVPVCMTNLAAVINHDFAGRQEYIRKLCSYQLLILDDFGMERDTSFALETVYDVIDGRYLSGKPLIVTTNLTLDELKKPQDVDHQRIYDRVLAMTVPIRFTGESLRSGQRNMKREIVKGIFEGGEADADGR